MDKQIPSDRRIFETEEQLSGENEERRGDTGLSWFIELALSLSNRMNAALAPSTPKITTWGRSW
jgi:hypothetical protein